ncbi:MAG: N-acetylglucosamine kinase [Longimicrobiales bacterium]
MKNQKISIGVDGGATHTTALVIDEAGRELARVVGGPGIVNPSDPPACAGRLAALARRAIAAAEAFPPVEELSCALAGAGRRDVREVVHAELVREHIAHRVTVTTDAEAALTDAFDGAAGILLIAGTGSIAWGRAEDGRLERCGGWGALLGDEGSGYALGLGALRSTVRGADGREPAARLHGAVLAELGLERPEALISWAAAAGKEQIAALAPLVLRHADDGDPAAELLRGDAARALVRHVSVLTARLGPWQSTPSLALAGGLLRTGGSLRATFCRALEAEGPPCRLYEGVIDAARGAIRLARSIAAS